MMLLMGYAMMNIWRLAEVKVVRVTIVTTVEGIRKPRERGRLCVWHVTNLDENDKSPWKYSEI